MNRSETRETCRIAVQVFLETRCRVDVHVDIDQTGDHVQPCAVDHLPRFERIDLRSDASDLVAADGHVHLAVDLVLRIDQVTALEEQVILRLGAQSAAKPKENK